MTHPLQLATASTSPLPYYIAPCNSTMASRHLIAHTARGVALQITTGANRLLLPYTLGLAGHVRWYSEDRKHGGKLFLSDTSVLLSWLARFNIQQLADIDLRAIDLAFAANTATNTDKLMGLINHALNFYQLSRKDRQLEMNITPNTLPPDVLSRLEMSLSSLESSLLTQDPLMPNHLRAIHSLLISYPESALLLEDAEIARIIDGAQIVTKTEIVKAAAPKTSKAKAAKVSADDL